MGYSNNDHKGKLREVFFNHAEDLFILFDENLNIIDANESSLRTWNIPRDQFIGKNLADISPDVKTSGRYDLYKEVIRTGKPQVLDEVVHHQSLGHIINRIKVFKVAKGMGGVLTNITDLVDTIEELNTFCYKTTHDLRRPIATILGLINIGKADIEDSISLEYLERIKYQAEKLDRTLLKLFETTRIRQGEKKIFKIDFSDLIDKAVYTLNNFEGLERTIIQKEIKVRQDFYNDKFILKSLLQNLLENALKYQKLHIDKPCIKIKVKDFKKGVKMYISDNGIGIPEQYHKDVFKMFFRATNQSTGNGLGLYTVSQCVKKLKGKIKLQSKENIGTSFIIYLPSHPSHKSRKEGDDEYSDTIMGRLNETEE